MKFFYKKNKICGLIAICFVVMLSFQIVSTTNLNDSIAVNTYENPKISAEIRDTEYDWLNNSIFDLPIEPWYNTTEGDASDVSVSYDGEVANYEILGEAHGYSNINGTPTSAKGWTKSKHPTYINEPTSVDLSEQGAYARHIWREDANQQVSVQWDKNIYMQDNMSDYVITSASLNMTVNATVQAYRGADGPSNAWNGEWGVEVAGDDTSNNNNYITGDQYNIGDFVRFYVNLADINKQKNYTDVISYKNTTLGQDSAGRYDYMYDNVLVVEDKNDLVYILNTLFHDYNNYNITITIGIYVNCDDNFISDDDAFESIYIKSVNLSFTYKKNINQGTKISWNQDGKRLSELSPENYKVLATKTDLRFDYSIDTDWSSNTSSINSELRVLLNGYDHKYTIKLTDVNLTYETELFELDSPSESVNISIEVYLRDEFNLDKVITISIDNVTLDISYIIFAPDPVSSDGGGGGGTTIIRGEDYTPVVIGLVAGIIGLVAVFGAYQAHFKHPPMVRKIRKLKKKIKKGKTLKSLIVNPREEIIRDNFKLKTRHVLDEEFLQSEIPSKIAKTPKNGKIKKINEKGGK